MGKSRSSKRGSALTKDSSSKDVKENDSERKAKDATDRSPRDRKRKGKERQSNDAAQDELKLALTPEKKLSAFAIVERGRRALERSRSRSSGFSESRKKQKIENCPRTVSETSKEPDKYFGRSNSNSRQKSRKRGMKDSEPAGCSKTKRRQSTSTDKGDNSSSVRAPGRSNDGIQPDWLALRETRRDNDERHKGQEQQKHNEKPSKFSFQLQEIPSPSSRKSQYKLRKTSSLDQSVDMPNRASDGLRCYQVNSGVLMHLQHPTMFSFQGVMTLRVLCGKVEVCGHKMKASSPPVDVCSVNCTSLQSVSTVTGCGSSAKKQLRSATKTLQLDCDELISEISSVSVVLYVQKLDSTTCNFVTQYSPFQTLLTKNITRSDSSVAGENSVLKTIGVQLVSDNDNILPVLNIPEDFVTISKNWGDLLGAEGTSPKILSCGGKNSGKSTFNRYVINSTLQRVGSVCYMDCDVGQTEFNAPGCVALHLIDTPVLGPPFTHMKKEPYFMCFFGPVSPAENPRLYSNCVRRVFQTYERMNPKPPLIINTMGWNKGLGVNLLVDTCHISRPDIVVQLESMNQANNFPAITAKFLQTSPGWIFNRDEQGIEDGREFSHELIIIDSPVLPRIESQLRFHAREHRDLATLGYFSACLETDLSLQSVQPYQIGWRHVALHTAHTGVPHSQILAAINASIVALCVADTSKAKRLHGHPDNPLMFERTPVCQCLGMGIVRGIDPDKKLLYLITPLRPELLQQVNTLIRGSTNIPEQLLLKQVTEVQNYIMTALHQENS